MKLTNCFLGLGIFFTLIGCGGKSNHSSNNFYSGRGGYNDGTYCAEIDYYYSKTGTNSTYILEVEIENNELTVIHWPNGGWLDDSHFSSPDISDGETSFTSDRGIEYTVSIIGRKGDCRLDLYVTDEDELVRQKEDEIREEEEEDERQKREEEKEEEKTERQREEENE